MECVVEFDYEAQESDELDLSKGDIITNVVQKMDGWWEGTLHGKRGMFPDNFVKVVEKPKVQAQPKSEEKEPGVVLRSNSTKSVRRLKALFSYVPEQEDELRLEIGDVVEYIADVEEGWWRGKLRGKVGIFPSNFVADADAEGTGSNNGPAKLPPEAAAKKSDDANKPLNSSANSTSFGKVPDVVPPAPPTSEPPPMDEEDEEEPPPVLPPKPVREQARCFFPYQAQNEDELTLNEGDIVTIISKNCDDEGWWRGELKGKSGLFPDNFVKIISPNEASSISKSTTPIFANHHGPKISPQERNLFGVNSLATGTPKVAGPTTVERTTSNAADRKPTAPSKKSNGVSDSTDGISSSKPKVLDLGESVSSKVQKFANMNFIPGGKKPNNQSSPSSSGPSNSVSLPPTLNIKREPEDEESSEFNAIERGEKLKNITAGRAKAPKRRPPSTILTKDEEENGLNGSYSAEESIDSPPPVNHSTPFNISLNNSMNNSSMLDSSIASENGTLDNSSGGSAKASKVPPWMAELKQKQTNKQGATSATSPVSLPSVSPGNFVEKEPPPPVAAAKAPPLPAKPNAFSNNNNNSFDKSPVSNPSVPFGGNKPIKKGGFVGSNGGYSNTPEGGTGGGDAKNYVTYEEYAKLRDKVIILETELEAVRRQLKLLLDRELNQGHIV